MIATAHNMTYTDATGGNYVYFEAGTGDCSDPTCGHYGSCSCDYVTIPVHQEDQVEPGYIGEPIQKPPNYADPLIQYQFGVRSKPYMSHRQGSTNKKIKMWSGLNS